MLVSFNEIKQKFAQWAGKPEIEQLHAVERGEKPVVLIDKSVFKESGVETNLPYLTEDSPFILNINNRKIILRNIAYIFYRPETQRYAEKIKEIYESKSYRDFNYANIHIQLGKLFGYNTQEILDFVNNGSYMGAPVTEEYVEKFDPFA